MKDHRIIAIDRLRIEVIWTFTRNGGFQRARIYKKESISEHQKSEFRTFIKNYLSNQIYNKYKGKKISEQKLLTIIDNFILEVNSLHGGILKDGILKFGNAQKIVNLFIKSMWICGWLSSPPPHFPLDRVIQKVIGSKENWTNMDRDMYLEIMKLAKRKAGKNVNLGVWEANQYFKLQNPSYNKV